MNAEILKNLTDTLDASNEKTVLLDRSAVRELLGERDFYYEKLWSFIPIYEAMAKYHFQWIPTPILEFRNRGWMIKESFELASNPRMCLAWQSDIGCGKIEFENLDGKGNAEKELEVILLFWEAVKEVEKGQFSKGGLR